MTEGNPTPSAAENLLPIFKAVANNHIVDFKIEKILDSQHVLVSLVPESK